MFLALVIIVFILGGLVYWYSARLQKRAHKEKLRLIREKIEANDKQRRLDRLNENYHSKQAAQKSQEETNDH